MRGRRRGVVLWSRPVEQVTSGPCFVYLQDPRRLRVDNVRSQVSGFWVLPSPPSLPPPSDSHPLFFTSYSQTQSGKTELVLKKYRPPSDWEKPEVHRHPLSSSLLSTVVYSLSQTRGKGTGYETSRIPTLLPLSLVLPPVWGTFIQMTRGVS